MSLGRQQFRQPGEQGGPQVPLGPEAHHCSPVLGLHSGPATADDVLRNKRGDAHGVCTPQRREATWLCLHPTLVPEEVAHRRGIARGPLLTSPAGSWPLLAGRSQLPGTHPWPLLGQMPGNKCAHGMPRSVTHHPMSQAQSRRMTSNGAKAFHRPCESLLCQPRTLRAHGWVHTAIQVPPLP